MPQFKIYTAMLSTSKIPVYKGEIWRTDINEVKQIIKDVMQLNPYYTIISDATNQKIVYNEFCRISYNDLQKYNDNYNL